MSEEKSLLAKVKEYEPDLGLRHRSENNSPEDLCEEYGKLMGGEMVNDEHVNRFEPVLADVLFSHEEMLRALNDIGVTGEADGLGVAREILNNQERTMDDEERHDIGLLRHAFEQFMDSYYKRIASYLLEEGHSEAEIRNAIRLLTYAALHGKAVDVF